jgi:hypothetical protein
MSSNTIDLELVKLEINRVPPISHLFAVAGVYGADEADQIVLHRNKRKLSRHMQNLVEKHKNNYLRAMVAESNYIIDRNRLIYITKAYNEYFRKNYQISSIRTKLCRIYNNAHVIKFIGCK